MSEEMANRLAEILDRLKKIEAEFEHLNGVKDEFFRAMENVQKADKRRKKKGNGATG